MSMSLLNEDPIESAAHGSRAQTGSWPAYRPRVPAPSTSVASEASIPLAGRRGPCCPRPLLPAPAARGPCCPPGPPHQARLTRPASRGPPHEAEGAHPFLSWKDTM
jgi:hypothetical protein